MAGYHLHGDVISLPYSWKTEEHVGITAWSQWREQPGHICLVPVRQGPHWAVSSLCPLSLWVLPTSLPAEPQQVLLSETHPFFSQPDRICSYFRSCFNVTSFKWYLLWRYSCLLSQQELYLLWVTASASLSLCCVFTNFSVLDLSKWFFKKDLRVGDTA